MVTISNYGNLSKILMLWEVPNIASINIKSPQHHIKPYKNHIKPPQNLANLVSQSPAASCYVQDSPLDAPSEADEWLGAFLTSKHGDFWPWCLEAWESESMKM